MEGQTLKQWAEGNLNKNCIGEYEFKPSDILQNELSKINNTDIIVNPNDSYITNRQFGKLSLVSRELEIAIKLLKENKL
jgi:hypothetical protein